MSDLAPIALFVFNRPWHTRQTVEALRRNRPAAESELIVFCDGPRNADDRARQDEIRDYLGTVDSFKSLEIEARHVNFGLSRSITSGVSQIVERYGKVIVLEDDLVCSPHFLSFMNNGLTLFEHEERVAAVHGYLPPLHRGRPDPFLFRFVDCWGWGTWSRAWRRFEPDGSKLLSRLHDQHLESLFNINDSFDYLGMLEKQISGEIDSWAIRWYASAFLEGMLGVFPGCNLIRHIGWNEGTHHEESVDAMDSPLFDGEIPFGVVDVHEDEQARFQLETFYRSLRPGLVARFYNRIKAIAGNHRAKGATR